MGYLIGFILGDLLGRIGFFRAAGAALLLSGSSLVSYQLTLKNVDPGLAAPVAIAVPVAIFAWAIWNPGWHRLRLWIVDGAYLAARIGMWFGIVLFGLVLVQDGFRVPLWIERAWTWAVFAAVLWVVQRALGIRAGRSHRLATMRRIEAEA